MDRAERLAVAVRATVTRIRLEEARRTGRPTAALGDEAIVAARALAEAWPPGSPPLLEWIGCTEDEYDQAVQAALDA